jgi:hypothetical protein
MWAAEEFWVSGFRIRRTCILYDNVNEKNSFIKKVFHKCQLQRNYDLDDNNVESDPELALF